MKSCECTSHVAQNEYVETEESRFSDLFSWGQSGPIAKQVEVVHLLEMGIAGQ